MKSQNVLSRTMSLSGSTLLPSRNGADGECVTTQASKLPEPSTKSHIDPVDQCRARGKGIFEALVRRRLRNKKDSTSSDAFKLYADREEDVEVLSFVKLNYLRMHHDVVQLMVDLNKMIGLLVALLNGCEAMLESHVVIADNKIDEYTALPDSLTQLLYNKEDDNMLRLPVTLFWHRRPSRKHLRVLLEFVKQNAEMCFEHCLPQHCELMEIVTKRRGANLELIFQPFVNFASSIRAEDVRTSTPQPVPIAAVKEKVTNQTLWCIELKSTYDNATLDLAAMMTSQSILAKSDSKTSLPSNRNTPGLREIPGRSSISSRDKISGPAGGCHSSDLHADDSELKLSRYFMRNLEDAQGMQWLCQQFDTFALVGGRQVLPALRCIWYVFNYKRRGYFNYTNFESDLTPWRFVVLMHYLFVHRFRATTVTEAILNTLYVLSGGLLLREHFKLPDPISCESPYNRDIFADMESEERKEICHYAEKMLQYVAEQRLEKIFDVDVADIQQEFARRAELLSLSLASSFSETDVASGSEPVVNMPTLDVGTSSISISRADNSDKRSGSDKERKDSSSMGEKFKPDADLMDVSF